MEEIKLYNDSDVQGAKAIGAATKHYDAHQGRQRRGWKIKLPVDLQPQVMDTVIKTARSMLYRFFLGRHANVSSRT